MVPVHVEVQPIWKGDGDKKPRAKGSKFKMQNAKKNEQTSERKKSKLVYCMVSTGYAFTLFVDCSVLVSTSSPILHSNIAIFGFVLCLRPKKKRHSHTYTQREMGARALIQMQWQSHASELAKVHIWRNRKRKTSFTRRNDRKRTAYR